MGTRHRRPEQRRGWNLVLLGYTGWVLGDVVFAVEQDVWRLASYPVPSDAIYLSSYLVLGVGLMGIARGRGSRRDLSILLDAVIIAVGTGVLTIVFVVAPIAEDSTLTLAGKVVSSAYPLVDVLMLGILVRVWTTPDTGQPAFRLLGLAMLLVLAGDVTYNVAVLATGDSTSSAVNDVMWLLGYGLLPVACWAPQRAPTGDLGPRSESSRAGRHLVALTGGLLLPAVALLLDGATGGQVRWAVIGIGSVLLSLLVLARMAGLLRVVQQQAVQLAALARSDGLTGAPNRRTWDHELSSACQHARDSGETLCVAMLDLDHFKRYNDSHGHQAGDRLLREAVAQWTDRLGPRDLLARYGGEEFAVLLPGRTLVEARARIDLLREVTPDAQTLSAGLTVWDPATDPGDAVRRADEALYDAKRAGRDQVCLAGQSVAAPEPLPVPEIVLQPIVDLRTGELVAVEALSRFDAESTQAVFARAHAAGLGPELEASALAAALLCRPPGLVITLNVSLAALVHPRIVAVLPHDLAGITLEISEHSDASPDPVLERTLANLRSRGARLAVDDWGRGFSNLDRLLRLRPEMIKLDLSLVHGMGSDYHRAMVRSVTAWADEVGAVVCAEGVETQAQRRTLIELGVHTAQGHLFGRPAAPGTYTRAAGHRSPLSPRTVARRRAGPAG